VAVQVSIIIGRTEGCNFDVYCIHFVHTFYQ
jgi:hypothetical protein